MAYTPPQKGSIDGPRKILRRLTPRVLEVARTRNSAKKNENGIFGISASRGLRKLIICHVFGVGGGGLTIFNGQFLGALLTPPPPFENPPPPVPSFLTGPMMRRLLTPWPVQPYGMFQ